ncbi:MAG: hypothetical protein IKA62_06440 [Clostridia bacterium]|nr:hypothetical protein [Clostridia bacterium]
MIKDFKIAMTDDGGSGSSANPNANLKAINNTPYFGDKATAPLKHYQSLIANGKVNNDTRISNRGDATNTTGGETEGGDGETVVTEQSGGYVNVELSNKIDDIMDKIVNREEFSYDLNEDALYEQYKDSFIQQGKLAMQDTMGQAAAMTGGFGNSYAATVGNQAYQSSLQELNDVVPELYQMALDQYNREGDYLLNKYGVVSDRDDTLYGRHRDTVADSQWQAEFDEGVRRYDESLAEDKRQFDSSTNGKTTSYEDWLNSYLSGGDNTGGTVVGDTGNTGAGDTGFIGNTNPVYTGITDEIRAKAETYTSNTALASYLDGLVDAGTITEEESDSIYAQYVDDNESYVTKEDGSTAASYKDMINSASGWSVVENGGGNLWGIDADAIVKAPNGEQMTLNNLRDKLIKEGMKHGEATEAIKQLQQDMGISSNWMFGW